MKLSKKKNKKTRKKNTIKRRTRDGKKTKSKIHSFNRIKLTKKNKYIKINSSKFKGGDENDKEMYKLFVQVVNDIQDNNIDNIINILDNFKDLINYKVGNNETSLLQQAILLEKPYIVELFIQKGADINMISRDVAPLNVATLYNCFECAELILLNGGDVNIKDIFGRSSLSIASLKNNVDILNLLLEYNANIESKDNDNKTALMYAAAGGYKDCVSILLDNGANIESRDLFNWTPLFYGIEYGASLEIIKLLLDKGAKVNIFSILNNTPLHIACKRRNIDFVKLLFDYGAKENINTPDKYGTTALMFASANNNYDIVSFLLENGADPLKKDFSGNTALKYTKNIKIQELLKNKMKETIAENIRESANLKQKESANLQKKETENLQKQNYDVIANDLIKEEEQRIELEKRKKKDELERKQNLKEKKIRQQILNQQIKKQQILESKSNKPVEIEEPKQETNIENLEIQLTNENKLQEEEDELFQVEIEKAIEESIKTYNSENEKREILNFWIKYFDNNEDNIIKIKEIIPSLMKDLNAFNLLVSLLPTYSNKFIKNNPYINNVLSLLFILVGIISYQLNKNDIKLILKGGSAIQIVSSNEFIVPYLSNDIDIVIISDNLENNKILAEQISKLLVWLTDENDGNKINSILSMIENKDRNHKIYKIVLNNSNISLMDIDYNILPDDITKLYKNDEYMKNYNLNPYGNNEGLFICPSIINLIFERIYYLIKYSSKEEIKSNKNRGFLTEKIPKSLNYLINVYYNMINNGDDKILFYTKIFDNFFQVYPSLKNESSYTQEQLIQFLLEKM